MKIKKRSGQIVQFDKSKIERAVSKAFEAKGLLDNPAEKIASKIATEIYESKKPVIEIEEIQDMVENELMREGFFEIAKVYILYRREHADLRMAKKIIFGVGKDESKLPLNAMEVLKARYLLKNIDGEVVESPKEMYLRVAEYVSTAENAYDKRRTPVWKENFFRIMQEGLFLPNSPTLMNAGTDYPQLAACFVIPVEDSIEGIFDAVKNAALIHKTGGGTGFSFSRLRPANDSVRSTGGIASGPVSFMKVFDVATEVIKQGGKRRGANMGVLRVDHPDIASFVRAKSEKGLFTNFNISVAMTDSFFTSLKNDKAYSLVNPRTGKETGKADAREMFGLIVSRAWDNGDPGVIFIDKINDLHTMKKTGLIEATNPCGEQPLLPNEACNLGSINLSKFVKNGRIEWDSMKDTISIAVRFLDDVIDVSRYPLPVIEKKVKENRKIGLGVMGFADFLVMLNIPYNSVEAEKTAGEVMDFIHREADRASKYMAEEKGSFPSYKLSEMAQKGEKPRRNATLTTVAPTGSISIITGAASGIEPYFDLVFIRNVLDGTQFLEVNKNLSEILEKNGLDKTAVITAIGEGTKLKDIPEIPNSIKKIFVTAHDVDPEWHVRIQAAFQKYTDNAVSKTVNFPGDATHRQVEEVYISAYETGCKGITIYRDGSRDNQVLVKPKEKSCKLKTVDSDYAGGCEECGG
ncbi:adenosylcobalamin-dependent ribonucleoside-diphosphate reductase [candidate division WOR-3 bacterium]|nr:adenosylcobalamin-dependent ribonucleoside-diphosphate reductase [candidate division WOR-3 bacterium]